MAKTFELHFSPIDGKDQGPIFAAYDDRPKTEHNMRVLRLAGGEYLFRLRMLQNELKEKYNSQFQVEASDQKQMEWKEEMSIVDKIDKEVSDAFPQSDYYNDLYYT